MRSSLRYYLLAVLSVALVALVRSVLARYELLTEETPFVLFVLAVVIPSWSGGFGPGMLATVLSALVIDFLLLDPQWAFGIRDEQQAVGLAFFVLQGGVISWLAGSKQRLMSDLEQSRTQLEHRVDQRTAELQQVNAALMEQLETNTLIADELRLQSEQLQRSNQELQDFASVASHDLQEPLRKIQAFGDRLNVRCHNSLNDEGRDYLARMQKAAGRMQVLINDLLTFSRVTTRAQPFQEVDLKELIEEVAADLETRVEQTAGRIEIGDLPTIEADPLQMRQLFQNLISNGLKFHREGVPPVVRIRGELVEGPSVGAAGRPFCDVYVQDNGIGFDEKYLDRIFEIFQRLHGRNSYEGTGIGLAVCRKIVDRHGGQIAAHSREGEGATFVISLPLNQSTPASEPELQTESEDHGTVAATDHDPAGR